MKRFKLFEDFETKNSKSELTKEQISFIEWHITGSYKMNEHGLIDVYGSFDMKNDPKWVALPVSFGEVHGFWDTSGSWLRSLKGFPSKVGSYFNISHMNFLDSLEGGPVEVGEDYQATDTLIKNLKGIAKIIKGNLDVYANGELLSLEGAPEEVKGDFDCDGCLKLTSLEFATADIGGEYSFDNCGIPDDQRELLKMPEIFKKWLKSGLSIEEFKHEKRGAIAAKKFGF